MFAREQIVFTLYAHLLRLADDNGHNDSIDGNSFTENDADQVLSADTRGFDAASQDARPGSVNAPKNK